jgi:hypothetical protein
MGGKFLKVAVVFLVLGLALGLQMSIGHSRTLVSVHAHVALMGWVSMALFGVAYRLWPRLDAGVLPKVHFWLYAPGSAVAMLGVTLLETRPSPIAEPLAAIGSMAAALGALCFVVRVLRSDLRGE